MVSLAVSPAVGPDIASAPDHRGKRMSWFYLALAIVLEICGTTCLKLAAGLTRLWPSLGIFFFYGLAFFFAALAIKKIDLGLAYAIWAGIGTAMAAVIGVAFFKEPMGLLKALSIGLIVLGVVGLRAA